MSRETKITAPLPNGQQKQSTYSTLEHNNTVDINRHPKQQRENAQEINQLYEESNNDYNKINEKGVQKQQVLQESVPPPVPAAMDNRHRQEMKNVNDNGKKNYFLHEFLSPLSYTSLFFGY